MIEWLYLKDLVDCAWESRRARKYRVKLLELARKKAMEQIVESYDYDYDESSSPWELVAEVLQEGAAGQRKFADFLTRYGFDESVVDALAFANELPVLQDIERMIAAADRRRDTVIREIERYKSHRAAVFRRASENLLELDPGKPRGDGDRKIDQRKAGGS